MLDEKKKTYKTIRMATHECCSSGQDGINDPIANGLLSNQNHEKVKRPRDGLGWGEVTPDGQMKLNGYPPLL